MKETLIDRLTKLARLETVIERLAFEMTKTEWGVYRKQHPEADIRHHHIIDDSHKQKKPVTQELQTHHITVVPKHKITLTKEKLKHTLEKGHYSVISAGRNPNDPKEAKLSPDDDYFHERHLKLQQKLEKIGIPYTEVVGHYGGKESTFMILHDEAEIPKKAEKSFMVHHNKDKKRTGMIRDALNKIGKAYNQDSVLHGDEGHNYLYFTTGKNKGKSCGGNGWEATPKAKDIYTDIELQKHQHTKFRVNVDECFSKGML